jgi:hypothetical protein
MKTIITILLSLTLLLTSVFANEVSGSTLEDEQAEVQMWISLIQKAEQSYIDMEVYPEETLSNSYDWHS